MIDIDQDRVKAEMRGHDNIIERASFLPGNCVPAVQELLSLVCAVAGTRSRALLRHFQPPITSKDDPASMYAVTASRDKTLKLWNASSGQCLWTFVGLNLATTTRHSPEFTLDGRLVTTTGLLRSHFTPRDFIWSLAQTTRLSSCGI